MRPFFSQNNLIDMLSGNDLDMGSIGKEKTAVFLITPDENTLYHPLVSVFVKQCYTELILEAQKQPSKKLPRRVNFLLDEFSSLPQISDFPSMITASRSRNIRFNLFVQSFTQLQAKYGYYAEAIKGNCENLLFLHSREYPLLEELVVLSGTKYRDYPLISVSMLQTLDKDKGEAFVLHKRAYPFIASLPDIDLYPVNPHEKCYNWYPENVRRAQSVFNIARFCRDNNAFFLSNLFSDKTLEEIRNIPREEEERFYMVSDDEIFEPIFTSVVPQEA
jgi:type IV secretion system protein VirD4